MDRIVLTTDLSDTADRAFAPTLRLAQSLGVGVTLLHVVPVLVAAPHGAPLAPPLEPPGVAEQVRVARTALQARVAGAAAGADVEVEVVTAADAARGIADYAKEHAARMIAMATHGRSGVRHLVLGSVAESVLRHAKVPVVCFPATE